MRNSKDSTLNFHMSSSCKLFAYTRVEAKYKLSLGGNWVNSDFLLFFLTTSSVWKNNLLAL